MWKLLVLHTVVTSVLLTQELAVIRTLSEHIGNIVLECKEEMGFGQHVIVEFLNYWNPTLVLSPNMGCAVACVLKKLEILDSDGKIKKENLEAFYKANGAGEKMAQKMMEVIQRCADEAVKRINVEDGCKLALHIARCYRYGIVQLRWAPDLP